MMLEGLSTASKSITRRVGGNNSRYESYERLYKEQDQIMSERVGYQEQGQSSHYQEEKMAVYGLFGTPSDSDFQSEIMNEDRYLLNEQHRFLGKNEQTIRQESSLLRNRVIIKKKRSSKLLREKREVIQEQSNNVMQQAGQNLVFQRKTRSKTHIEGDLSPPHLYRVRNLPKYRSNFKNSIDRIEVGGSLNKNRGDQLDWRGHFESSNPKIGKNSQNLRQASTERVNRFQIRQNGLKREEIGREDEYIPNNYRIKNEDTVVGNNEIIKDLPSKCVKSIDKVQKNSWQLEGEVGVGGNKFVVEPEIIDKNNDFETFRAQKSLIQSIKNESTKIVRILPKFSQKIVLIIQLQSKNIIKMNKLGDTNTIKSPIQNENNPEIQETASIDEVFDEIFRNSTIFAPVDKKQSSKNIKGSASSKEKSLSSTNQLQPASIKNSRSTKPQSEFNILKIVKICPTLEIKQEYQHYLHQNILEQQQKIILNHTKSTLSADLDISFQENRIVSPLDQKFVHPDSNTSYFYKKYPVDKERCFKQIQPVSLPGFYIG